MNLQVNAALGLGVDANIRDPQRHISISILKGYPYLIGLPY